MANKILHVSESDEWSGGGAQLMALAEGLRTEGWDVRIGCRPGSGLDRRAIELKFPTFHVAIREDYDIFSAWTLANYIQSEGIQVVHAHHNRSHAICLLAKLLIRLRGAKGPMLVVSRRVSFPPGNNPFSRWKYQSRLIDKIVAVADAVKDVLVTSGVAPERVAVIRSGVDAQRFTPAPADAAFKKALGLPEGVSIIGKISNAAPTPEATWKGQNILLEAAALLMKKGKAAHFLLAGRDTNADWLRREVERLGLEDRVSLLGFRTDVPQILACLSISVNAAVKGEGLSGALRESLTMGVPVVASDMAGNRELLKAGVGGYLFEPGNAQALADKLEWVLDHLREAKASALQWRQKALGEFSQEQTITRTAALYRALLPK
jgi:glycosyltransferase involved in cell wall biosynthesis